MTFIANTIRGVISSGLNTLSWENRYTVVCPINSNIISLINKVHHDRRLCRIFILLHYWYFDGTWINNHCIRNGLLTAREFEILWSDRSRLPRYLLEEEDDIIKAYRKYAAKGFYYHYPH